MQVAAFLSDLKSLSICSHEAAIALVKPAQSTSSAVETGGASLPQGSREEMTTDSDLEHANELVSLHYGVKIHYREMGPEPELIQAARDVDRVISSLNGS